VPPPLSNSQSDVGSQSAWSSNAPTLRQSLSFSTADRSSPPSPPKTNSFGPLSPRPQEESIPLKASNSVRKKTGFSNLMNSILGSPRRVEISSPSHLVHVTHVGFNFATGEFTVSGTYSMRVGNVSLLMSSHGGCIGSA